MKVIATPILASILFSYQASANTKEQFSTTKEGSDYNYYTFDSGKGPVGTQYGFNNWQGQQNYIW